MEAALVHRVEEFEAAMTGFKPELETDGPRTGALGGSGGGESGKGLNKLLMFPKQGSEQRLL